MIEAWGRRVKLRENCPRRERGGEKTFQSAMKIDILDRFGALAAAEWEALLPAGEPFLAFPFLDALERHGAAAPALGWVPRHLCARDDSGRVVGALPLYVKFNSFGEFIHDWSWADAYRQAGLAYYPKLFTGIPFTPTTGPRLLLATGVDPRPVRDALVDAALELGAELGSSSWHVAFPSDDEARLLAERGFLERRDIQFHWHNRGYRDFADFLDTFSAEKRRKIRRDRRRVVEAGIEIEALTGDAVEADTWPTIHRLYAATFERYGNHPAFTAGCLAEIGRALGTRMVVLLARRNGQPLATALCFRNQQCFYGRYWGAEAFVDGLHFELCYYRGIEYCIAEGLERFEPGAGGEHKIARGFEPTEVATLHWIADPRMRAALADYLRRQRQTVAGYREEAAGHLPFRQ